MPLYTGAGLRGSLVEMQEFGGKKILQRVSPLGLHSVGRDVAGARRTASSWLHGARTLVAPLRPAKPGKARQLRGIARQRCAGEKGAVRIDSNASPDARRVRAFIAKIKAHA